MLCMSEKTKDPLTHIKNINIRHADSVDRCCPCDNTSVPADDGDSQARLRESLKYERKVQLAKDAKHASAALTFLGVLIMGTVLYSRIWRSNSQFPEQKKTDFNSTSEYTTASEVLARLHRKFKRRLERPSRLRKKRRKSDPQSIPLLDNSVDDALDIV